MSKQNKPEDKSKKEGNIYDKIFKENIRQVFMPLIERELGIKIENWEYVPEKVQKTTEREGDFLYKTHTAKKDISVFGEGYHLSSISFDRGFYSGPAKEELSKIFDLVVMPKPGKQSKEAVAEQSGAEYQHQKRRHSTVEANINELEYCGADKVPDKGIVGYKKYVALSVLTYNIKRLGKVVKAEGLLSTIRNLDSKKVA